MIGRLRRQSQIVGLYKRYKRLEAACSNGKLNPLACKITASNVRVIFISALLLSLLSDCAEQPIPQALSDTPSYPPPQQDSGVYHSVRKGDTLYAISRLFNLDYRQLAQWNQIQPPYTIEIGQKIRVSDPNNPNATALPRPNNTNNKTPTELKPKTITPAAVTSRISSQKKDGVQSNNKPGSAGTPPNKASATKKTAEKNTETLEKKSIISIDKESMLKLNFQWPIKGRILNYFSQADSKGIDIAGKIGQDVHAAEAGKVVYSGQSLIGYGNLLIIKHNDVYLSAYANNSQLLVTEGYAVRKGDIVAKVGQVAHKKASLYFEIRKNGKPVNPLGLLPKK
ncbi:MAG: peptidoglycan DD-metalloendopeptidase family protein [Methylobacter sp.]